METSNRRNLAGVRVKQQNLVYVIGLVPSVKDESTLLQTLRGTQYFGQYGEIEKIVVSKARPGASSTGIGVYITYATKQAAASCIEVVDGSMNGDRVLRYVFPYMRLQDGADSLGRNMVLPSTAQLICEVRSATTKLVPFYTRPAKMARPPPFKTNRLPPSKLRACLHSLWRNL